MPRLRRADCSAPGIRRVRRGRGFSYVDDSTGDPIAQVETLERIRELTIPPAWQDVWICPWPNGHIQAVGTDARGRRQYRYHDHWRELRDREKFDRMLEFGRALPRLRELVTSRHLRRRGPDPGARACRRRPTARPRLLPDRRRDLRRGERHVRPGDDARRHVRVGRDTCSCSTTPQGRAAARAVGRRPAGLPAVSELKRRRGGDPDLLAYKDRGRWRDVVSSDVNAYIKDVAGEEFTAKDFRTWTATVLAAVGVAVSGRAAGSATARKRAISRTVQEVAHYLGNTPAVCRASYIDPRVFDHYAAGDTVAAALDALGDVDFGEPATQGAVEAAVIELLSGREAPLLARAA